MCFGVCACGLRVQMRGGVCEPSLGRKRVVWGANVFFGEQMCALGCKCVLWGVHTQVWGVRTCVCVCKHVLGRASVVWGVNAWFGVCTCGLGACTHVWGVNLCSGVCLRVFGCACSVLGGK